MAPAWAPALRPFCGWLLSPGPPAVFRDFSIATTIKFCETWVVESVAPVIFACCFCVGYLCHFRALLDALPPHYNVGLPTQAQRRGASTPSFCFLDSASQRCVSGPPRFVSGAVWFWRGPVAICTFSPFFCVTLQSFLDRYFWL